MTYIPSPKQYRDMRVAAMATWRPGRCDGAIVSDLPYGPDEKPLDDDATNHYGGRYLVGESMSTAYIVGILAAAHNTARGCQALLAGD